MVMRLTPKGRRVSAWVPAISAASASGIKEPPAMTPKPPALLMADTSRRSLTQLMAPPMMATLLPRKRAPRSCSRSSAARAAWSGARRSGLTMSGI